MRRYVLAAALVALAVPAVALAKGPASASISGPGLGRSIAITGDGEGGGTTLGALASTSGFFPQMFGQSPDPMLASRPTGALGPRYTVVYVVPGPNEIQSRVVQSVYPYAKPRPITFMKPGQNVWNERKTRGGWYRASSRLKAVLVRAGLPTSAP